MGNPESRFDKKSNLCKQDIIRGHNAYKEILQNSIIISSEFLKAFIQIQKSENFNSSENYLTESPLLTNNVKVGFIVAKKKIRKAVSRNRIKRLLKETYRMNKYLFEIFPFNLNIILSLTGSGYDYFLAKKSVKYRWIEEEFIIIYNKFKIYSNDK